MKIDIIIAADYIDNKKVKDKAVLVIDMLRATSVIVTAIKNGCEAVIPVVTIEEAMKIANANKGEYLLGGERQAVKIENFNFSNSPLEYTVDKVKNKKLIMTTTNGTRAIKGCIGAKNIIIGAMINAKAAAHKLLQLNNDIIIVNAGTNGEFSIDDFICSGYIINLLKEEHEIQLSDIATTALYIYEQNKDIKNFIMLANHYKKIQQLGLFEDLEYCCQKDIIDVVPEFRDGIITGK